MSDTGAALLGEGLAYDDRVPLRWEEIPAPVSASELLAIDEANERVFRSLAVLEEHQADPVDEDQGGVGQHLARVEFKINLLLELVARILAERVSMPVPVPIRMSASAMVWECAAPPPPGCLVRVEIFLNRKYPTPAVLLGGIKAVQPEGAVFRVKMAYEYMSEHLRGRLEKHIFRQHRRSIAHARRAGATDQGQA